MRYIRILFIALILAALALPVPARAAAQGERCDTVQVIDWRVADAGSFMILYPEAYALIGQRLSADVRGRGLDREYERFKTLYETSLPLPITIRIYPDVLAYTCLNAQPEDISNGALHTHIGAREIALIGDNILSNFPAWAENEINFVRYELSVLFARQVAGDRLPPGLAAAIGHYAQDPAQTIGRLELNRADWLEPPRGWRALWEEPLEPDLARKLQLTSTVAYLVDSYGWPAFLAFLQNLTASQNFSAALEKAYRVELAALEEGWQAYYPRYFQGGWRYHALYNFDLTPYRQMIQVEKYGEAERELADAAAFLASTGQLEKRSEALNLQAMARSGLEGENLFAQSQVAFQAGQYDQALALLEQAEQKYGETSNRFYYLDAISAHRRQVERVLALHEELDELRRQVPTEWNTFALAGRLVDLGLDLGELGDTQGHAQVMALAQQVEARQREQFGFFAVPVIALILMLLGLFAWLLRRTPPPEAQL